MFYLRKCVTPPDVIVISAISNEKKKMHNGGGEEKRIKRRLEINYLLSGALFSDPFSPIIESREDFRDFVKRRKINFPNIKCFLLFTP